MRTETSRAQNHKSMDASALCILVHWQLARGNEYVAISVGHGQYLQQHSTKKVQIAVYANSTDAYEADLNDIYV